MKTTFRLATPLSLGVALLCGCQSPLVPDEDGVGEGAPSLTLTFAPLTAWAVTPEGYIADDGHPPSAPRRAGVPASAAAPSRLDVAVFQGVTRLYTLALSAAADTFAFAAVPLALAPGTYTVVALAHSGDGKATITSPDKATFASSKVTDTYLFCAAVRATAAPQHLTCPMSRCTACVALDLGGWLPAASSQLKAYYLGGSSTLSPSLALGIVQSRQTELRAPAADGRYYLHTIPHTRRDVLTRLTLTALAADGHTLRDTTLTAIPVEQNSVTEVFWGGSH